jgi:hypothetical protein
MADGNMRRFLIAQIGFLLYGLAFWLPVAAVLFALLFLARLANAVDRRAFLPAMYANPWLSLAIAALILYFSGLVLRLTRVRVLLAKVPLVGTFLFGGGQTMTANSLLRLKPCLFMVSPTRLSYGWILSEEKVKLEEHLADFTIINVYHPYVPLFVTGQVASLRQDSVMRLGNSSKEIVDVLLYALRTPDALVYLPWEDESSDHFLERATKFGVNPASSQLSIGL